MESKIGRMFLLVGAPLVACATCRYYISLIPRFDIGFNDFFITASCILVTCVVSILAIIALYKLSAPGRSNGWACFFVTLLYWLFVWGFCYGKCVLEATRDLQMMLYGE
ncbi:MAG: hypothetical protein LIP08_00035 [Bacteroides sp.]|nr:hypothetical protein [Bacteroides sp.]